MATGSVNITQPQHGSKYLSAFAEQPSRCILAQMNTNSAITHAGCVVFREDEGGKRFLVVSSSSGDHWVLPKGHIKKREEPEQAALRELEEEAGVLGEIIQPLSIQSYIKNSGKDKEAIIQYYLVQWTEDVKPREKREIRWKDAAAALALLSFESARSALQEALAVIEKRQ